MMSISGGVSRSSKVWRLVPSPADRSGPPTAAGGVPPAPGVLGEDDLLPAARLAGGNATL
jgi:hypothetical protein